MGPLWTSDRNYFIYMFDLQVALLFRNKFPVCWPVRSGEKFKIVIDGGHLRFPIGTILAVFELQIVPILPTKF